MFAARLEGVQIFVGTQGGSEAVVDLQIIIQEI